MPPDPIFCKIWNWPFRMSRPMNGSCGRMGSNGSGITTRGAASSVAGQMLLRSESLSSAGFLHGFPTRDTPDEALLEALRARPILQVKQVHGARAVLATAATGAEGDALVSRAADRLPVGV